MKIFCLGGVLDGQWVRDHGDTISQLGYGETGRTTYTKVRTMASGAPVVYTVYLAEGVSHGPDEIIDRFTNACRRQAGVEHSAASDDFEALAWQMLRREHESSRNRLTNVLSRYEEDDSTKRYVKMWVKGELPTFAALQTLLRQAGQPGKPADSGLPSHHSGAAVRSASRSK